MRKIQILKKKVDILRYYSIPLLLPIVTATVAMTLKVLIAPPRGKPTTAS